MNRAVWKYPLPCCPGETTFAMPRGARVLSAHNQYERPTLWALVNAGEALSEQRRFRIVATGEVIPDDAGLQFIGTVLLHIGDVLHIFEVQEPQPVLGLQVHKS